MQAFIRSHYPWLTVPTQLTLLRLVMTPLVAYTIYYGMWYWATVWFCIAAVSDALDGYLARAWNQETTFGAYLDPVVDKIFITTLYGVLWAAPSLKWHLPGWFVLVIALKECVLLAGAWYYGLWRQSVVLTPTYHGKAAMVCQTVLGWNVLLNQSGFTLLTLGDIWFSVWCTLGCVMLALRSYSQRVTG